MKNELHRAIADEAAHPLEGMAADVVCVARRAGWYTYEPGDALRLRERVTDHYVMFLIIRGEVEFWCAGRRRVVATGGGILTPPRTVQTASATVEDQAGMSLFVIHFSARIHGLLDPLSLIGFPETFELRPNEQRRVVQACKRMVAELAKHRPGSLLMANAECAAIVGALWRHTVGNHLSVVAHGGATMSALVRLKPVFDAVQADYARPIAVVDLARIVHLHPIYFSVIFKRCTGLAPGQYVTRYRIDRACDLLASTDASLDEIAHRTGYGSSSHLSHTFRRVQGMSPGEYRRLAAHGQAQLELTRPPGHGQ